MSKHQQQSQRLLNEDNFQVKVNNLIYSESFFTEEFTGKMRRGEMLQPTPKNGNNLSVKVCVKECMCVSVRGSENDSFPLSQSS